MPQSRRQKRLSKRFPVHFGVADAAHLGFAKNVSLGGLELSAKTVYHADTLLTLEVAIADEPIRTKGIVRWVTRADALARMSGISLSMGVELTVRPDEYVDAVLNLANVYEDGRQQSRFSKIFKVIFESPRELMEQYTQDISMGGIFVISDEPPPIDTLVDLQLIIAETMQTIRAEGVVVHVVDQQMVQRYGLNPGFGVQFVKFHDEGEKLLAEYIKQLKQRMGIEIDPRDELSTD
ncbi:MAG: PilZ domain-containing protein [Candidatus Alcyoniella australis]|nr:PilZ domain-containing protein [Candidatus Alcyoniella australis]